MAIFFCNLIFNFFKECECESVIFKYTSKYTLNIPQCGCKRIYFLRIEHERKRI